MEISSGHENVYANDHVKESDCVNESDCAGADVCWTLLWGVNRSHLQLLMTNDFRCPNDYVPGPFEVEGQSRQLSNENARHGASQTMSPRNKLGARRESHFGKFVSSKSIAFVFMQQTFPPSSRLGSREV